VVVPGGGGWKAAAIADAVVEDKIRHTHPIGTVQLTCPSCRELRQMARYRIADGPFGTHKALHLHCGSCRGLWSVDKAVSGPWTKRKKEGSSPP